MNSFTFTGSLKHFEILQIEESLFFIGIPSKTVASILSTLISAIWSRNLSTDIRLCRDRCIAIFSQTYKLSLLNFRKAKMNCYCSFSCRFKLFFSEQRASSVAIIHQIIAIESHIVLDEDSVSDS